MRIDRDIKKYLVSFADSVLNQYDLSIGNQIYPKKRRVTWSSLSNWLEENKENVSYDKLTDEYSIELSENQAYKLEI